MQTGGACRTAFGLLHVYGRYDEHSLKIEKALVHLNEQCEAKRSMYVTETSLRAKVDAKVSGWLELLHATGFESKLSTDDKSHNQQ